jgi:hypothetical protein
MIAPRSSSVSRENIGEGMAQVLVPSRFTPRRTSRSSSASEYSGTTCVRFGATIVPMAGSSISNEPFISLP